MPVRGCWPNLTTWRMWERCASATSSSFASSTTIRIFGARSRSLPPVACNPACARPAWPSCPSAAATDTTSHTVHGHQYSPPGLARLSAHGLHTEKVLRKGAMQGNREAQIMLALMYYHGCHSSRCPLTFDSWPFVFAFAFAPSSVPLSLSFRSHVMSARLAGTRVRAIRWTYLRTPSPVRRLCEPPPHHRREQKRASFTHPSCTSDHDSSGTGTVDLKALRQTQPGQKASARPDVVALFCQEARDNSAEKTKSRDTKINELNALAWLLLACFLLPLVLHAALGPRRQASGR